MEKTQKLRASEREKTGIDLPLGHPVQDMSEFSLPKIPVLTNLLREEILNKINSKTKPLGSLGILEDIAFQLAQIQNTLSPTLTEPRLFLFAGDHGIAEDGVSLFPKDVTWQMVENFLAGGACANVFANHSKIQVSVVDSGVDHSWTMSSTKPIDKKIALGTKNFRKEAAMSKAEAIQTLKEGINLLQSPEYANTNVFLFGEMGIGNTSSASLILSQITGLSLEALVGKGTGLSQDQKQKKLTLLSEAQQRASQTKDPIAILSEFGGFEIGMMAGAMLGAAALRKAFVVDGFISTSAYAIAHSLAPEVKSYAIFSHVSDEEGHKIALQSLQQTPLLQLKMRLGEGSGALAAYPLLELSVKFLNEMASFADANVSEKREV